MFTILLITLLSVIPSNAWMWDCEGHWVFYGWLPVCTPPPFDHEWSDRPNPLEGLNRHCDIGLLNYTKEYFDHEEIALDIETKKLSKEHLEWMVDIYKNLHLLDPSQRDEHVRWGKKAVIEHLRHNYPEFNRAMEKWELAKEVYDFEKKLCNRKLHSTIN